MGIRERESIEFLNMLAEQDTWTLPVNQNGEWTVIFNSVDSTAQHQQIYKFKTSFPSLYGTKAVPYF